MIYDIQYIMHASIKSKKILFLELSYSSYFRKIKLNKYIFYLLPPCN